MGKIRSRSFPCGSPCGESAFLIFPLQGPCGKDSFPIFPLWVFALAKNSRRMPQPRLVQRDCRSGGSGGTRGVGQMGDSVGVPQDIPGYPKIFWDILGHPPEFLSWDSHDIPGHARISQDTIPGYLGHCRICNDFMGSWKYMNIYGIL